MSNLTVLMPVRAADNNFKEALASIARQSYRDYDILLIVDGDIDCVTACTRAFPFDRVRVLEGPGTGLASALALGVEEAESKFIARMDGDDIAEPDRLGLQMKFFRENNGYVLLGTGATVINDAGERLKRWRMPRSDRALRLRLCFDNAFVHPSVVFLRQAAIEAGNYFSPSSAAFPEDFHLWSRIQHLGRMRNLPAAMIRYRSHDSSLTMINQEAIGAESGLIASENLSNLIGESAMPSAPSNALALFANPNRRVTWSSGLQMSRAQIRARYAMGLRPAWGGIRFHHYLRPANWALNEHQSIV